MSLLLSLTNILKMEVKKMINIKVKKCIVFGTILLFVGASITPNISGIFERKDNKTTGINSENDHVDKITSKTVKNNISDWRTYQKNNKRTGVTNAVGAEYNWTEKLTYDIGDRVLSPVVGDLDGDGHMDAVFSSDVTSPNLPVYAVDLVTGDLKWSFMPGSAIWSTPTLADLNDDGKLDVTFGAGSDDGHIYALYHNGTKMWDYFTGDYTNSIDSPSGVADVDGDGKPEVLVGGSCYYCPSCDTFFVLNGEDGSLLWGVNIGSTLNAPTIGEFDGDPGVEIVMGGYDGYVRVFDGENGNEILAVKPDASGWIESTPAIVDYGYDGIDDIAVFSGNNIYLLDGSNGNTIWSYPTAGSGLFGGISAGDIDEDGEPEILAYPYYNSFVYAINLDGTLKWTRDVGYDSIYASPSPAIADIDGDTHPEVIIQARSSGMLYALNGNTGEVEYSFSLGTQSISSLAIADTDGDGIADIITGCNDGKLYVIGNSKAEPVICGDLNNDGIINIADFTYIVSYLYGGGPAPIPYLCIGDSNIDSNVNVADMTYILAYLYGGGPAPCNDCCTPIW